MKVLKNSTRELIPLQKYLFYRSCVLPITLYSFQLWFYNRASLSYSLRVLNLMQQKATIWILSTFHTSSLFRVEAITGLIPINLHLCKLSCCAQLHAHSLSHNHILWSLLESQPLEDIKQYSISLNSLTHYQRGIIKRSIIDIDNKFNKVFSSFDFLNVEFSPGSCLINIFPNSFSFHSYIKQKENNLENYTNQLNDIATSSLLNHPYALVISDTSIKNNIAISISHIYAYDRPIVKAVHHATNITTTKVELFAIRCSIN